ncbi:hypothetical protein [Suttonella ornithocola]|uniref:Uncharacterized protein n=1 Tax=Suttonella ornithocola TaxID=279832 RepID=A0A380MT23_9GAMM|nr:hypothetical protein [Suttonella ornithocola]SUO95216.1 Uncharacterised protein [Suttonella ornithocola]
MSSSLQMRRLGRAVAYYPQLSRVFGSVTAAILFAQLFYWMPKATSDLGVFKTAEDLTAETGLSVQEQRTARKILREKGVLIETHKRLEHKLYFKIDEENFDGLMDAFFGDSSSNIPEMQNQHSGDIKSTFAEHKSNNRHIGNTGDYLQEITALDARPPAREKKAAEKNPPPVPPKRKAQAKFQPLAALLAAGVEEQTAADYLATRKKPLTQTALNGLVREAEKAGLALAEVCQLCAERGWQGFNANWDWQSQPRSSSGQGGQRQIRTMDDVKRDAQAQAARIKARWAAEAARKNQQTDTNGQANPSPDNPIFGELL